MHSTTLPPLLIAIYKRLTKFGKFSLIAPHNNLVSYQPEPNEKSRYFVKRDSIAVTIYEGTNRGKPIFTVSDYEGAGRKRVTRSSLEAAKAEADRIINRISAGDRWTPSRWILST